MKIRYLVLFMLISMAVISCQKPDEVSKIPQISLSRFASDNGSNLMRINMDSMFLNFSVTDGDADIGVDQGGSLFDIYIKDMRSGGFQGYFLPDFDKSIEDPKKGIAANCEFLFEPYMLEPRLDSIHLQNDTTYFEFYIVDRAGHESNHITTPKVFMYK